MVGRLFAEYAPEVTQVPVDLHNRLSEFSYGYGVTREVERLLAFTGLRTTPFLPSLLHEAVLGFDVKFDRPGAALLLQFKLGEALQRFRRDDISKPPPPLGKPFWRFSIDTAEQEGTVRSTAQSGTSTSRSVLRRSTVYDMGRVCL